jgi:hypothetical protein
MVPVALPLPARPSFGIPTLAGIVAGGSDTAFHRFGATAS